MNNDRQQQEQNQEKNEASTYSMEQQMRQQSPSQVPSPPCIVATPVAPDWPAIQLKQDCLKHAFRGLHGAYKRLPHNLGCAHCRLP